MMIREPGNPIGRFEPGPHRQLVDHTVDTKGGLSSGDDGVELVLRRQPSVQEDDAVLHPERQLRTGGRC